MKKKWPFLLIIPLVSASAFLPLTTRQINISPNSNLYYDEDNKDYGFNEEDQSKFVFKYNQKIWEFNVEKYENNSNIFDLNFELNKYKNNNKNNKINLINKMQELGFNNEIIIKYLFPKLINKIKLIQKNIEKTPKNAEIIINNTNNKINIKNEIIGNKINLNLFYELILNNYKKNNLIKINIPCEKIIPEITKEILKKSTNKRGEFSTDFSSSTADRKHNIRQAIKKINGTILEPNEIFSFNKIVGKRTEENGYRVAKIIYNGNFVDGVGGGVCQVSSSLYNAVLLSGLNIIESNKHSERVHYVNAGFDAMVNYGSSDLKFVNNTNNRLYILANYSNNRINISIFGESKAGYSYELKSEIIDVVPCGAEEVKVDSKKEYTDKVLYNDESFYLKKARDGCTIKSYRLVYYNGNLIKNELLRTDKYPPQHAVKIIGSELRPISFDENLNLSEDTPKIDI